MANTGQIYTLTENRGAAKVIRVIGKYHVEVLWSDGVKRKISVGSLCDPAETATASPAPQSGPNRERERRKADEREFALLKDRIREAN